MNWLERDDNGLGQDGTGQNRASMNNSPSYIGIYIGVLKISQSNP